jgi:hypothetical protein
MLDSTAVRLSLEELSFAILHEGRPAVIDAMVTDMRQAGLSPDAVRSSVRSAQHSLLARGLLDLEQDGLADQLRRAARGLVDASHWIAYRRPNAAVFYYVGERGTFERQVAHGVVHTIQQVDGIESMLHSGLAFFDIHGSHERDEPAGPAIRIPVSVFNELKQAPARADVERVLAGASEAQSLPTDLIDDLCAPAYRGDVLRAIYDPEGRPRADRNVLVLGGAQRSWLLRTAVGDEQTVTVPRATPSTFRREVTALLR